MQKRAVMPTTWFLLALILMLALHFLLPWRVILSAPWNLIGGLPFVLGLVINVIADKAFHRGNTTVKPFQTSTTLITDGVFAFTRNPMYLGFVLVLLGVALLLGTVTPLLVVLPFAVLMHWAYIQVEEHMLAETFGSAWEKYRHCVRRWI